MTINERPLPTYNEALNYLNSLINYERKPLDKDSANTLDLTRPPKLAALVGSPQNSYPAIHIAGTKGKGSVAAMTASCLRMAGYRVGLYTSPHLQDFRERIRILTPEDGDGRIPEADFVDVVNEMKTAVSHILSATWFEVVTILGLLYFAQQHVDIAVVETGLGGRFDATRVVHPLVCVITSLSLDHTDLLGNTLAEIAFEKAGIMKPDVPVVVAPQKDEAMAKLVEIATERSSPLTAVSSQWRYHGKRQNNSQALIIDHSPARDFIPDHAQFPMALDGDHQLQNGVVALAALQLVRENFPALTETAVRQGLSEVVWNGRLQIIHRGKDSPTFLVDGAHNPDSISRLVAALQSNYSYQRLILIFGAPADKNVPDMLVQLLPLVDLTITAAAEHPRAADPEQLAQIVRAQNGRVIVAPSIAAALTLAWQNAQPADLICATGSLIFIGDLLNWWDSLKSQLP